MSKGYGLKSKLGGFILYPNMTNIDFKMLKTKLCTLVLGLIGEDLLRKRQKLTSLLIRFSNRKLTSLILTSFYIEISFIYILHVKVT